MYDAWSVTLNVIACARILNSARKFADVVRRGRTELPVPPSRRGCLLLRLLSVSVGGCLTFQSPIELRRSQFVGGATAAAACPMSIRPSFTNTAHGAPSEIARMTGRFTQPSPPDRWRRFPACWSDGWMDGWTLMREDRRSAAAAAGDEDQHSPAAHRRRRLLFSLLQRASEP